MKKNGRFGVSRRKGFTLIEMLVVIAIIGILAAILTPALKTSVEKAKRARAQTEVNSIASAVQAYANEYGKMPVPSSMQGQDDDSAGNLYSETVTRSIIKALAASDGSSDTVRNPRRIVFLEMTPNSSNQYVDTWGRPFLLKADTDYNNRVKYRGTNFNRSVIVWSDGPRTDISTDDVTSSN